MSNEPPLSLAEETAYICRLLRQAQDRWTRLKRRDPETKLAWENIMGTLFGGTAQELIGAAEMIRTMNWIDGLASWFEVSPLGEIVPAESFPIENAGIASMLAVMIQYRQPEAPESWLEVAASRQALNRIIVRGCQLAILPKIPHWIEHELLDSLLDCSRILAENDEVQVDVCRYPVTQFLYEQVTETNPSAFLGDLAPVDTVSWLDAVQFCNRLSELLGLEKPYHIGQLPSDAAFLNHRLEIIWNRAANGFRLPTVREWVAAARSGSVTRFPGGDNAEDLAVFKEQLTANVGSKASTAKGIFDLSGNVWEWCWDSDGLYRHRKGGSWNSELPALEIDYSSTRTPFYRSMYGGFRIVRGVPSNDQPEPESESSDSDCWGEPWGSDWSDAPVTHEEESVDQWNQAPKRKNRR